MYGFKTGVKTIARTAVAAMAFMLMIAAADSRDFLEQRRRFREEIKNKVENKLDQDGNVLFRSERGEAGIKRPMGIAVDSLNNAWVSNSGVIAAPCYFNETINIPSLKNASVTMITSDGVTSGPYQGGGTHIPWGIAVDGNDNIWVANFGGFRVTQLCGARPENCPPGVTTGGAISPES